MTETAYYSCLFDLRSLPLVVWRGVVRAGYSLGLLERRTPVKENTRVLPVAVYTPKFPVEHTPDLARLQEPAHKGCSFAEFEGHMAVVLPEK